MTKHWAKGWGPREGWGPSKSARFTLFLPGR